MTLNREAEFAGLLRLGLELADMPADETNEKWLTWSIMVRRALHLPHPDNPSPEYLHAVAAVEAVAKIQDEVKAAAGASIVAGGTKGGRA